MKYEEYKGMSFKKWCAQDVKDERTIVYENIPGYEVKITSNEKVDSECMGIIQTSFIEKIKLVDNEWHVWLTRFNY